jgi:hypothetical protein
MMIGSHLHKNFNRPACTANPCVQLVGADAGTTGQDSVRGRYISSLQTSVNACRVFAYRFDEDTVQRSEITCNVTNDNFVDLADRVLALNIHYQCSDGTEVQMPTCTGSRFLRSAKVQVVVASDNSSSNPTNTSFALSNGTSVECPKDRYCFAMAQEVLMPNLKGKANP